MPGQWLPAKGVEAFERYVVAGEEELVFVMRKHWVILAEPLATAAVSAVVMMLLVGRFSQSFGEAAVVAVLAWLVVAGRAVYYALEWQASWFGSTQRRLMLTYGLITRKVAMMPLEKVTDMSYNRSPLGQMLGYGEFVLESAGQDQALRSVTFVPDPDRVYRRLVGTMFGAKKARSAPKAEKPPVSSDTQKVEAPKIATPAHSLGIDEPSERVNWHDQINEFLANSEPTVQITKHEQDS